MAKKKINKFIFEPGISKDANLFPNAVALLIANRSFIQAQVVAFINAQITAGNPPYDDYTYEPSKCTRDVGFFIDAIAHDLRYGGNVKIRQIADYFWIDGRPMIRGNPAPEISGQQYIASIINDFIFKNIPVTPSYNQLAVAQTIIEGQDGEEGADDVIVSEFALLGNVIENGIEVLPEKVPGVSALRLTGKYDLSDFLLITDTENGEILYNFADSSNSIKISYKTLKSSGDGEPVSDVDFRSYIKTTGTITEVSLSKDTSTVSGPGSIQIFVEEENTTIRPWSFGTDAIERMRVSNPQAMLDADFEYGLQPTKWQQISLLRSYPSVYEVPGTDYSVVSITTDASTTTGDFGSSRIQVKTNGSHGLRVGDPITVKGLNTTVAGFARAEGSFLVANIFSSDIFEYFSGARVGSVFNESLFSSSIQIRKGGFYTGASIGNPVFSVATQGTSILIETVFDTALGSDRLLAFSGTGTPPVVGSSITGTNIPPGTSISGIIGAGPVTVGVAFNTVIGQVFLDVTDVIGIQQGMVVDNGLGTARAIQSISGNRLNLDGTIDVELTGSFATYSGIQGVALPSPGVDAAFNVTKESGIYIVTDREDSSSNGQNYQLGDIIRILGTDLGGTSPANDLLITVNEVDSQGTIISFTFVGSPGGVDDTYISISGVIVGTTGSGLTLSVTRTSLNYSVVITDVGFNYFQGNVLTISGDQLEGVSPNNDLEIVIDSVDSGGSILSISTFGAPFPGQTITAFPTITISEFTLGPVSAGTIFTTGAVSQIEVNFESAHGLLPGTSITTNITTNPNAETNVNSRTLPSSGTWTGVAWDGSIFAAVRSGSNLTAISPDGEEWEAGGNLPNTNNWSSIAGGIVEGINYFVAVASNNNTAAWSDNGGLTWTATTLPAVTTTTWNHVCFFNGVFIAVRAGSTGAARSVDGGQTWTTVSLPSASTWTSVYGTRIGDLNIFVAVASGGTNAAYSSNLGSTWSATSLPASLTWRDVAGGNGRFVAVASGTDQIAVTTNGLIWTANQLPSSTTWETIEFDGNNFVALSTTTAVAISQSGLTNQWDAFTVSNGTWNEIGVGGLVSDPVFVAVGSGTNAITINTMPANHQIAGGSFVISEVPSLTSIRYAARTAGMINDQIEITGEVYVRPDTFFVHRPYDGGVQLGTGGPQHGVQAVRQSKKYIRYQSGKGIMYTTGALFAPSYNLASATADGTTVNSVITFTTDETDHGLQPGGIIEIKGFDSFEYNGTYTVQGIVDSKRFRVNAQTNLSTTTAVLGPDSTVTVKNWHGASIRSGAFDDQNGIFWQYNGQTMSVGLRSSTFQLAGTISVVTNANGVTGSGTRFKDQLFVGDKIVIKGMTHVVTSITSQTELTISPDYRGAADLVGGKMCKTQDFLTPQEDWNLDALDGTGPSGFVLEPTKMQMIGMQYTWYAAGFIEFMLRGDDGKFIIFHRVRNSNINTEAYMRTANLPVRYEVINESAKSYLKEAMDDGQTFMVVSDPSDFPTGGVVYVDNELISYSGKSGNRLLNLTRSAQLSNFAAGQNRSYSAGPADSHEERAGVILISCTITPVISHWGSALLTDGRFDEDRGYLFSYAATGVEITTSKRTAFLIRLAPSVSNALVGDLGERELLNRAQLLLKEISITADSVAGGGGIVIEGVLNPQNYPDNPGDISWVDLTSSGAGGQPSFAQIAPGGSVNWRSAVATTTATVQGQLTATFTAIAVFNSPSFRTNAPFFYLPQEIGLASGIQVGDICATRFPPGTVITQVNPGFVFGGVTYVQYRTSANASANVSGNATIDIRAAQTSNTYSATNFLFFTQTSWIASGASLGTRVAPTDTKFPAGTAVNSVEERTLGLTTIFRVGFTQTSTTSIAAAATVTFDFEFNYALPGEQVFSFISNPGDQATLDLSELKELTTTAIGGRGAFPNGPDVLAINVFKVSGAAANSNVIIRWGEAQA
jgi:hypothetical protein